MLLSISLVNGLNSFGGVDHKHGADAVQLRMLGEELLNRLNRTSLLGASWGVDRLGGLNHDGLVVGEEVLDGGNHCECFGERYTHLQRSRIYTYGRQFGECHFHPGQMTNIFERF